MLNSKPQNVKTRIQKLRPRNPESLIPVPEALNNENPEPQIRNPEPQKQNPEQRNPECEMLNPKLETPTAQGLFWVHEDFGEHLYLSSL